MKLEQTEPIKMVQRRALQLPKVTKNKLGLNFLSLYLLLCTDASCENGKAPLVQNDCRYCGTESPCATLPESTCTFRDSSYNSRYICELVSLLLTTESFFFLFKDVIARETFFVPIMNMMKDVVESHLYGGHKY